MDLPVLGFHRNGRQPYVVFCVWLEFSITSSGIPRAVAWVSASFLFVAEQYAIMWTQPGLLIHLSVGGMGVVSTFSCDGHVL